ncbi:MAG: hypothetical protein ACREH8_16605, partial [Opitutaceae bacterium]
RELLGHADHHAHDQQRRSVHERRSVPMVARTNNNTSSNSLPATLTVNAGTSFTTFAGIAQFPGGNDGTGAGARFNSPSGITTDLAGNVYIADTRNHTIRRTGAPTPAQISVQPANRSAGVGGSASFNVTATGAPNPGYQWQRQPANSFGFTNLANDGVYRGVNTATLTITGVTQLMSGDQFRVVVNNGIPPAVESSSATLTVGIAPVFTSPNTASFQAMQAGTCKRSQKRSETLEPGGACPGLFFSHDGGVVGAGRDRPAQPHTGSFSYLFLLIFLFRTTID